MAQEFANSKKDSSARLLIQGGNGIFIDTTRVVTWLSEVGIDQRG